MAWHEQGHSSDATCVSSLLAAVAPVFVQLVNQGHDERFGLVCSLERGEDGSLQVQKVQCARVYHINVVLRIRTSLQDTRKDKAYKEKSMQIQRSDCNAEPSPL